MVTNHTQVCTELAKPLHCKRPQFPKGQLTKRREPKHLMKRQFKVRLVEKSLPANTEPETVATTGTSTQTSVVKPTATAAKPSLILITVYNLSQTRVHKIPNPAIRKFQEGKTCSLPIVSIPL